MKILLLGFAKMKIMPYASFYLDSIDFDKNDVEIVYWNRDLRDEDLSGYNRKIVFHEFRARMDDSIRKNEKLKFFWRYRKFVTGLLKKSKYDLIVSLHTLPGLLVWDKLLLHYKKRYILDYRDSTFEANPVFGWFVRKLASNAKLVFVSSDGFRRFLPDDKVETITSHNLLVDSLKHRDDRKMNFVKCGKIRISFWGLIRHLEHNKMIISRLANDSRFELHYYGREGETAFALKDMAGRLKADNIFFHGEYKPTDRYSFSCMTDIIHNSYDDANMRLAMGNKYYDGIIFRIPLLCMPGSFMAEQCEKYGVGFAVDPSEDKYADLVYGKFKSLNPDQFQSNCDAALQTVVNEFEHGKKCLDKIFNN